METSFNLLLLAAAALVWAPWSSRNFLVGHLAEYWKTQPCYLYEAWQRQLGGIFLIFLGKTPIVVISNPELIRQASVAKFRSFHDRPALISISAPKNKRINAIQSGLLMARGGYWTSLRAAMQPLFHTAALNSYAPIVTQQAQQLADKLRPASESGAPVELHSLLGRLTMGVIGQAAFGIPFSIENAEADMAAGVPNVGAAVKTIFGTNRLMSGGGLGGLLLRLLPVWMEPLLFRVFFTAGRVGRGLEYARSSLMSTADLLMQNALRRTQKEGRKVSMVRTDWQWWSPAFTDKNPYKDTMPAENSVIDMLMRATNKETGAGLTDVQIGAQCNTLLAAGYETSSNSLAFAIHLLASHPEAQVKVQAEVDDFGRDKVPTCEDLARFPFINAVLHESLRLYPPGWMTTREANEDVMLGHWLIPKGTQVHFNIYGLHRDSAHWPEPEAFRPERFLDKEACAARHPNAFLAFGVGPRMCIAWRFAMQEMALALIRLYQQYSFELPPGHAPGALELKTGITIGPADGVHVIVHARK